MGGGFAAKATARISEQARPRLSRRGKAALAALGVVVLMAAMARGEAVRQWAVSPEPAVAPSRGDLPIERSLSGPTVLKNAATGRLMMWYWATYRGIGTAGITKRAIGLAWSDDGKTWTKPTPGPLFADDVSWPGVLHDAQWPPEQRFKIWFNVYPGGEIRYAWSRDGIAWQGQLTVLETGPEGEFDDLNVAAPCVLRGPDGTYMMYYDAGSSAVTERAGFPNNHYIALAVSGDGEHWTKRGVVLTRGEAGAWDAGRIYNACVLYDPAQQIYEMWYAGRPGSQGSSSATGGVGYAVSLDGVKWMKSPRNPDLPSSPESLGPDRTVAAASVLKDAKGYHMWFDGDRGAIGCAELPPDAYREEHQTLKGGEESRGN